MRILLIKFLVKIFAGMPLAVCHFFGAAIGWLISLFPNKMRDVTQRNIELCFPASDAGQRKHLVHRSLIETGKTLVELGPIWLWPKQKVLSLVKGTSGEEYLIQAMQKGNGVILAAPHLGCWELLNYYCDDRLSMTSLYKPPRMVELEEFVHSSRQRFGAKLVPTNAQGVRTLYHTLSQGGLIGILPDQDPGNGSGVFAPFFGIPANTMTFVSRLVQKSHATVIFAYAERLAGGAGYHIHFIPAEKEIEDKDLQTSVTALNLGVETCVRSLPEQYQWGYKRFKTRPDNEIGFYKKGRG